MARDYARLRLDMWITGDIRALSPEAQHLYFVLLTHPQLSYCGVADWRPGRLAAMAKGWTAEQVRAAAEELVTGLYIVIDEASEEVLVRSFIRNDGLMKEARVAVSMVRAFGGVASAKIRGVIVHELGRLWAEDQSVAESKRMKGWRTVSGQPGQVLSLLDLEGIDPADLPQDLPLDLAQGLGNGLAERSSNVSGSVSLTTSPAPSPTPAPSLNRETPAQKRGTRIPEDFAPTDIDRAKAKQLGFTEDDLSRITAVFVDYWRAVPGQRGVKLDWDGTWRNWVRKDAREHPLTSGGTGRRPGPPQNEWEMGRR